MLYEREDGGVVMGDNNMPKLDNIIIVRQENTARRSRNARQISHFLIK